MIDFQEQAIVAKRIGFLKNYFSVEIFEKLEVFLLLYQFKLMLKWKHLTLQKNLHGNLFFGYIVYN